LYCVAVTAWACPQCKRRFTRRNQRHACGTSDGTDVLRNRSPELVETYLTLEKLLKAFGDVELVKRDRYVLFRSARIFADVVIMSDAVRLAFHLSRQVAHESFVKVVRDRRHVTHVVKLQGVEQVRAMEGFLREAYEFSIS
jgi:predicted transport protein